MLGYLSAIIKVSFQLSKKVSSGKDNFLFHQNDQRRFRANRGMALPIHYLKINQIGISYFLPCLLSFSVSILCLRTSKSFLLDQLPYVQTPGWISLHFPIFHLVTSSNAHLVKYHFIFKCHNSCFPLPPLWWMKIERDLELYYNKTKYWRLQWYYSELPDCSLNAELER